MDRCSPHKSLFPAVKTFGARPSCSIKKARASQVRLHAASASLGPVRALKRLWLARKCSHVAVLAVANVSHTAFTWNGQEATCRPIERSHSHLFQMLHFLPFFLLLCSAVDANLSYLASEPLIPVSKLRHNNSVRPSHRLDLKQTIHTF